MSLALCLRLRVQPAARVLLSARVHPQQRLFLSPRPPLRRPASFFPWSRPSNPSLDTAAQIAALEAHANADPNSLPKNLAFFKALAATRSKEGYDTLIDRWEHTAERVSFLLCLPHPTHISPESLLPPPLLRRGL